MELEVRSGQLHHNSTHGHLSLLTGPGLTLSGAEDIPDKQAPVGPHYPRHRLVRPLRDSGLLWSPIHRDTLQLLTPCPCFGQFCLIRPDVRGEM